MTYLHILSVMVVLLAISRACWSCKVANWHRMTVAEQAREAHIIVFGRITAHYPMPDVPLDRAYIAEMSVACTMKGEVLPSEINISEAGELTSCHHTLLPVDATFITFLKRDPNTGLLVPDEVNHLSVAFSPTNENIDQVNQAVNIHETCPQLFLRINDGGEGPDGHDGGRGDGDNGANGVSGSAVCIIAMVIMAWLKKPFEAIWLLTKT